MGSNPSPYPPSLPPPSPNNVPFDLHFANQQSTLAGLEHEVYQHGSIGEFITSTIEGVQSGFMRCIYRAKDRPSHETVTLLCEKQAACCVDGCCPKDQFWMGGVIILMIFVVVLVVFGALCMLIFYQRSKSHQRKKEREAFEQYAMGSDVGGGTPNIYARPNPVLPRVSPTPYASTAASHFYQNDGRRY